MPSMHQETYHYLPYGRGLCTPETQDALPDSKTEAKEYQL